MSVPPERPADDSWINRLSGSLTLEIFQNLFVALGIGLVGD